MIIELEYSIGDKVKIIELERPGKIISIWITPRGIQYEVRYFNNSEVKMTYFYPDELKLIEEKS